MSPALDERVRRCIACRTLCSRSTMFCLTYSKQSDSFSINNSPPVNGRSAYFCRLQSCYDVTVKGKKLQKALKRAIPSDILGTLDQMVSQQVTQLKD